MATGVEEHGNHVTVLWRIENIGGYDKALHEKAIVSTDLFIRVFGEKYYCQLKFLPGGEPEGSDHVCLKFFMFCELDFAIDIEFSILFCDGSPVITRTVKDQQVESCPSNILMPDCPTYQDMFETNRSSYMPRDRLTVRCRIWKSNSSFLIGELISASSRFEVCEDYCLWPVGILNGLRPNQVVKDYISFNLNCGCAELQVCCWLIGDHLQQEFALSIESHECGFTDTFLLKLAIYVLGRGQRGIQILDGKHVFPKRDSGINEKWNVSKFLTKEELAANVSQFEVHERLNLFFHATAVSINVTDFITRKLIGTSSSELEIINGI